MFSRCRNTTTFMSATLMTLALAACGQSEYQASEGALDPQSVSAEVGGPCTSNAQCSGDNPICDVLLTRRCQPCLTAVECTLKDATHPWCLSGACVGCVDNTSCGGNTPVCNTVTRTCVAGTCPAVGTDAELLGLNLSVSLLPANAGDTRV